LSQKKKKKKERKKEKKRKRKRIPSRMQLGDPKGNKT
jgi:hypothetical protein